MNKTETRVIQAIAERLRNSPHSPHSTEVREALEQENLRRWLDSWILPALDILAKPNRRRFELSDADYMTRLEPAGGRGLDAMLGRSKGRTITDDLCGARGTAFGGLEWGPCPLPEGHDGACQAESDS